MPPLPSVTGPDYLARAIDVADDHPKVNVVVVRVVGNRNRPAENPASSCVELLRKRFK